MSAGEGGRAVTARELAERWKLLPHLTVKEAKDLAADLKAVARSLPRLKLVPTEKLTG